MKKTGNPPCNGFTLIELLVVVGVIGILVAGVLVILDPIAQVNKAQDSKRLADIKTIKESLEVYSHDTGCFPEATDFDPSDPSWAPYLNKMPKDPSGTSYKYYYQSVSCPSWGAVFAILSNKTADVNLCNLPCVPTTPSGIKWGCAYLGIVECPLP